jgi:hypothetical protein
MKPGMAPPAELVALCGCGAKRREDKESSPMTLSEALAVKARGLTKEQLIALLRTVAEDNLRADIRTIERAWKEKP